MPCVVILIYLDTAMIDSLFLLRGHWGQYSFEKGASHFPLLQLISGKAGTKVIL